MARPKKKPEYDSDQMAQQIMEAVTDAYLNPLDITVKMGSSVNIRLVILICTLILRLINLCYNGHT